MSGLRNVLVSIALYAFATLAPKARPFVVSNLVEFVKLSDPDSSHSLLAFSIIADGEL